MRRINNCFIKINVTNYNILSKRKKYLFPKLIVIVISGQVRSR